MNKSRLHISEDQRIYKNKLGSLITTMIDDLSDIRLICDDIPIHIKVVRISGLIFGIYIYIAGFENNYIIRKWVSARNYNYILKKVFFQTKKSMYPKSNYKFLKINCGKKEADRLTKETIFYTPIFKSKRSLLNVLNRCIKIYSITDYHFFTSYSKNFEEINKDMSKRPGDSDVKK